MGGIRLSLTFETMQTAILSRSGLCFFSKLPKSLHTIDKCWLF